MSTATAPSADQAPKSPAQPEFSNASVSQGIPEQPGPAAVPPRATPEVTLTGSDRQQYAFSSCFPEINLYQEQNVVRHLYRALGDMCGFAMGALGAEQVSTILNLLKGRLTARRIYSFTLEAEAPADRKRVCAHVLEMDGVPAVFLRTAPEMSHFMDSMTILKAPAAYGLLDAMPVAKTCENRGLLKSREVPLDWHVLFTDIGLATLNSQHAFRLPMLRALVNPQAIIDRHDTYYFKTNDADKGKLVKVKKFKGWSDRGKGWVLDEQGFSDRADLLAAEGPFFTDLMAWVIAEDNSEREVDVRNLIFAAHKGVPVSLLESHFTHGTLPTQWRVIGMPYKGKNGFFIVPAMQHEFGSLFTKPRAIAFAKESEARRFVKAYPGINADRLTTTSDPFFDFKPDFSKSTVPTGMPRCRILYSSFISNGPR